MFSIRPATPEDAHHIHRFITELAIYEKEPDAVEVTPEELAQQLSSSPPPFECVLACIDGQPIGFALFFHSYSTWKGRRGLYLEDLYVQPSHRGQGYGLALLQHLAALAVQRGCARFEWAVLDWNTPAIQFYEALGARPKSEWIIYQLTGDALTALSRRSGRG
jgi:GNAT superfamily N-acetyltransferase